MLLPVFRISYYYLPKMKPCKLIKKRRYIHIEIIQISYTCSHVRRFHTLNELSYLVKGCNETLAGK